MACVSDVAREENYTYCLIQQTQYLMNLDEPWGEYMNRRCHLLHLYPVIGVFSKNAFLDEQLIQVPVHWKSKANSDGKCDNVIDCFEWDDCRQKISTHSLRITLRQA
ncbi:hypothetical protein NPIL_464031 [Nephila pilipes]|uniref:Uncharacterized protein n=1 Tax=Nephila pilipes TaxID=299642 RepID=A0A8X6QS76_NEPPI|nr:hypothetical protein NPIL_464031 [Nephila pilipes]